MIIKQKKGDRNGEKENKFISVYFSISSTNNNYYGRIYLYAKNKL